MCAFILKQVTLTSNLNGDYLFLNKTDTTCKTKATHELGGITKRKVRSSTSSENDTQMQSDDVARIQATGS